MTSPPLKRLAAWVLLRSQALRIHHSLLERGRAFLLLYHRVNDQRDPFFPSLARRLFTAQLDYVARCYRVEPLDAVVEWLAQGAPGPPRLAITIDDGYPDTLDVVLPELQRRGLPATLFLSTGPLETGEPLWIDRARWLVKHARAAVLEAPRLGLAGLSLSGTPARLGALARLLHKLKGLAPAEIEAGLAALEEALGVEGPALPLLGWNDVRRMAAGPIRLGAHTHRHFMLSRLGDAEQEREVGRCLDLIEQRTGVRARSFAYPNGQPDDYDARSIAVLRRLGLRCALTATNGPALPGQDLFRLPRIATNTPSLALFAARLAGLSPRSTAEVPVA